MKENAKRWFQTSLSDWALIERERTPIENGQRSVSWHVETKEWLSLRCPLSSAKQETKKRFEMMQTPKTTCLSGIKAKEEQDMFHQVFNRKTHAVHSIGICEDCGNYKELRFHNGQSICDDCRGEPRESTR